MLYAGSERSTSSEPVAKLWHAATLLRGHRGDGHNIALIAHGIGGLESHVLIALSFDMRPEEFDRLHHLPVGTGGCSRRQAARSRPRWTPPPRFTDASQEYKERIEALTDELRGGGLRRTQRG